MNKKHEPAVILKTLILIFCIINVIALFLVLKHEKQTQNNAQVISYDVTEEETEEETTSSQIPSPVISLDESLIPDLSEDDLYDLKNILISVGALSAEDGQGNDVTDGISWTLTPVADQIGTFDADFLIQNESRRSSGASCTVSAELTSPFLFLSESNVTVARDSTFSISSYIKIAMDIDGSDITEYVTCDDYVNTASSGTYNITLYVYSRVADTMTRKNLTVTVQ